MTIELSSLSPQKKQYYLQHIVAPRPICFASTIDKAGNINLSPFSFFNLFSSNPPVVIFSPARRVRDNTTKHSLENLKEVPEVVINMVSYDIVQQTSLASCEYPKGTNEFVKAGLTEAPSLLVKPPRVAESRAAMECRVMEIKSLGEEGGAGQLVICEVLMIHLDDAVLEGGDIRQDRLDLVARLGADWYSRASSESLFIVPKPNTSLGMGVDALPLSIRESEILTGNHLGKLANTTVLPESDPAFSDEHVRNIVQYFSLNPTDMEKELHKYAAKLLNENRVAEAWQVLLMGV